MKRSKSGYDDVGGTEIPLLNGKSQAEKQALHASLTWNLGTDLKDMEGISYGSTAGKRGG